MIIRRYRPSDQAAVIGLFREFMWELTPPLRDGQGFWVADNVVGMVGIERQTQDSAELRRMAVKSSHRRKGIGRELLRTAEAFCRECSYRKVVLSTSEKALR